MRFYFVQLTIFLSAGLSSSDIVCLSFITNVQIATGGI